MKINRRNFIKTVGASTGGLMVGMGLPNTLWAKTKPVEIDLSGDYEYLVSREKVKKKHTLTAQETETHFFADQNKAQQVWSFAKSFAPLLVLEQDKETEFELINQLPSGQSTTIHWHGLRIPNEMDGVPHLTQDPVENDEKFNYRFAAPDAGSYWYHPHINSAEQLGRGLVGPMVVLEKTDYPVDLDLVVMLKDWRITRDLKLEHDYMEFFDMAHGGRVGNITTVNGRFNPNFKVVPDSRIRLRVINTNNASINELVFPKELNPTLIALDGNPVKPKLYKTQPLAPGMRMDVVIDLPKKFDRFTVMDKGSVDGEVFSLTAKGQPISLASNRSESVPLSKNPIPKPNPDNATVLTLDLEGGAMSGMMGMGKMHQGMLSRVKDFFTGRKSSAVQVIWSLNGMSMTEDQMNGKPMYNLKLGETYLFKIRNLTAFEHPVHFHGHSFNILSYNGKQLRESITSDTVFLFSQETTEIVFVADNPGKWMFHCHIIEHQISGMMGVFEVS